MLKKFYARLRAGAETGRRCTFHVSQGDLHNARKDWPGAIHHYRKALNLNPALVPVWVQLGHGYRELGDMAAAEEAYQQALQLDPENDDALFFLGVTLNKKGEVNDAFNALLQAFEHNPSGPASRELAALTGVNSEFPAFFDAVGALFDSAYYLKTNSDLRKVAMDPKIHYMMYGWKEGRSPSPFFDANFYKQKYKKLIKGSMIPLVHYWQIGRALNLRSNPGSNHFWFTPEAPAATDWSALAPARYDAKTTRAVVILPVYRGYDETLASVYRAVRGRGTSPYSLLVINDCGPEARLNDELARLAKLGLFDYVVNDTNRGFVQTCNRGIQQLSGDKDIVLLNSDAFVPPGWFDRMIAHADRDPLIATITPLSNNATICSYPAIDADNYRGLELSPDELDALAATTNRGIVTETMTGVGFCFYMRRKVIDAIGALDPVAFKVGYGEENDFCMRSLEAGYKNVIATDIFVFHVGSVSFSAAKDANFDAGQRALAVKHPNYTLLTRRHAAADPTRRGRQRLDRARLVKAMKGAVVFITHAWGGGIETYLSVKQRELDKAGTPYVTLTVRDRCFASIESCDAHPLFLPNLSALDLRIEFDFLCALLRELQPSLLHVNSFAGLAWAYQSEFLAFITNSGLPYRYIAHDYSSISRFYHMVRPDHIYCGIPDWNMLDDWSLMTERDVIDSCPTETRRATYSAFLRNAQSVECPSPAALRVLEGFYSGFRAEIVPHSQPFQTEERATRRPADGKLRIACIGAIGGHKGSDLILALARDAAARDLDLEYVIVGYSDQDADMKAAGVSITGAYASDDEAIAFLQDFQPDLVFISSIWPETYCYTLSIPLALGQPFMVFDIGAQAERAATVPWSVRLDPALINAPNLLSDTLLKLDVDALWQAVPAAPKAATSAGRTTTTETAA